MKYTELTLPTDHKILHNIVLDQQEKLNFLQQQYESLQHQLSCLLRQQFGKKSEQGIPGQASLFAAEAEPELEKSPAEKAQEAPQTSPRKKPRQGQRQFPAHFTRHRIEYDLPEEKKICHCGCNQALRKIGEDILEQLEIVPATMVVIEHVRFKYAAGCAQDSTVITADMPRQPIDKSMAGPGLLADVIVKKYDDHLPLYRQSEIFARHGIELSRSTLCDWMGVCAKQFKPIVEQMQKMVLTAPKIHTDDTPVPVLEPGLGKTKTGRLWIYLGSGNEVPPCAVYDYTPTREQIGPMAFLKGYQGNLQADAYQGYDILYDKKQVDYHIIEIGCWAHVRRKFYEIAKLSKTFGSAHQALLFIQKLYHIEKQAHDMDDEARKQLRQEKAKPILDEFKVWLDDLKNRVLPKSPLGEAVNYTIKNWPALNRYVDNGLLAIDNNAAERLIKPIKIGVKNYLFAGSDQGAETAAIFYSLIETCKLHHINPYDYLRDVLIRLPTQLNSQIHELLPWNWKLLPSITKKTDI